MSQPKSLSLIRLASTASMTALALSLIANPAPAQAAGACGVPAQDVVDCGPEDAPFPNGIDYSVVGDLTVNIGDDLLVEPDPGHAGIILSSDGGSIVVNGGGADVTARDSSGIVGFATGDLTVAIDDVSTHGLVARGIDTFTFAGDTVIDADSVTTSGDYAFGIIAQSGVGDISVAARSIDTNGYAADGITASTAGDISITAEDIRGAGDYVWGNNVSAGGYVDGQTLYGIASVEVGSIEISGDHAVGVVGVSYGDTTVKVDRISIDGDYGTDIGVIAMGDIIVEVGDATFTGQYTGGIVASTYGEASVIVGTLTAEYGGGVVAFGLEGATAVAGSIAISGNYSNGIQAVSRYGGALVEVGEVSTDGI